MPLSRFNILLIWQGICLSFCQSLHSRCRLVSRFSIRPAQSSVQYLISSYSPFNEPCGIYMCGLHFNSSNLLIILFARRKVIVDAFRMYSPTPDIPKSLVRVLFVKPFRSARPRSLAFNSSSVIIFAILIAPFFLVSSYSTTLLNVAIDSGNCNACNLIVCNAPRVRVFIHFLYPFASLDSALVLQCSIGSPYSSGCYQKTLPLALCPFWTTSIFCQIH